MKVTLDSKRILHLISLILSSYLIAKLLQVKFEWTPLSAWGVAISTTCQVSNAIMSILDPTSDKFNNGNNGDENKQWLQERKRELEKRKERRKRGGGGAASVTADAADIADNGNEKKD